MINQLLQFDPVKGNNFAGEYDVILEAMKRNDISVQVRAQNFMTELMKECAKIPGDGIECPKCKMINARGVTLCSNCGTNLLIVHN
jgi:hypothetical protein